MKELNEHDDSNWSSDIGKYDWIKEMICKLEESDSEIDRESLKAFLIMEGRSEERSLKSHLKQLILHLLKWKYQPDFQSRSWRLTIGSQRDEIHDAIKDSKTFAKNLMNYAHEVYEGAKRGASRETGINQSVFPEELEFTEEQLLDFDFMPK